MIKRLSAILLAVLMMLTLCVPVLATADEHAARQPEDHARGHVLLEREEGELAPQLAVIAAPLSFAR